VSDDVNTAYAMLRAAAELLAEMGEDEEDIHEAVQEAIDEAA
jgi:hypothetical protein